jgi:hypothetical protein
MLAQFLPAGCDDSEAAVCPANGPEVIFDPATPEWAEAIGPFTDVAVIVDSVADLGTNARIETLTSTDPCSDLETGEDSADLSPVSGSALGLLIDSLADSLLVTDPRTATGRTMDSDSEISSALLAPAATWMAR